MVVGRSGMAAGKWRAGPSGRSQPAFHSSFEARALSTSTLASRMPPITKNTTTDRTAGRPDPVRWLTMLNTSGPQIAENFEKTL